MCYTEKSLKLGTTRKRLRLIDKSINQSINQSIGVKRLSIDSIGDERKGTKNDDSRLRTGGSAKLSLS